MINIQNLTRKYGAATAVKNVSVEIRRGEIVGLLGHNGAGKTTVMKILTGFLEPSDGTVTVGGFDVTVQRDAARKLIGYLPENAPLYLEMLVQDYLMLMAELRGVEPAKIPAAVARAAEDTGLVERLLQPIGELSKGYRQRVGLAQAIVHDPAVLVLDEPTNGLDPMQIQSIRELIRRLGERTTIILSTHIMQEIEAVCDRVLVMIQGELVADAPLATLTASDTVLMSVAAGTVDVDTRLSGLTHVRKVRPLGVDPDHPAYERYAVDCDSATTAVSDIARVAVGANWTLGSLAPEQKTLESVFKSLQHRHIEVQGGAR
jgi:ABC-2 type transport system ATP-binding protein